MSAEPPDRTGLRVEVTVEVPVEHAFRVFTERFDEVKPREHNLLTVPIERTVLEPRVGGTICDIGVDGSTCVWARILAYDPPHRLLISWDIGPRWEIEPDHGRTSEVDIRFLAEAPERTRVVVEHRHLDRHGEGWEGLTGALGSDQGWPLYLRRFRAIVTPAAEEA